MVVTIVRDKDLYKSLYKDITKSIIMTRFCYVWAENYN